MYFVFLDVLYAQKMEKEKKADTGAKNVILDYAPHLVSVYIIKDLDSFTLHFMLIV